MQQTWVEDISNFLKAAERAEAPADTLAFPACRRGGKGCAQIRGTRYGTGLPRS